RRACRLVGDVRYVLLPLRLADAIADRRAEVRRDRLRVGVPDPYRAVGAATGQAARRGEFDAVDRLGRGVDGGESDRPPWIRDVPQPQRAVTTARGHGARVPAERHIQDVVVRTGQWPELARLGAVGDVPQPHV